LGKGKFKFPALKMVGERAQMRLVEKNSVIHGDPASGQKQIEGEWGGKTQVIWKYHVLKC
jgi:hypothetical protein